MGRSSRGVALGDGKVFVAQIDAKLVALDQKNRQGRLGNPTERLAAGLAPSPSAPLYYDGLVIMGYQRRRDGRAAAA